MNGRLVGWYLGDGQRTGYFDVDLDLERFGELWRYESGRNLFSPPTTTGALIVLGTNRKATVALDQQDGTVVWTFETERNQQFSPTPVGENVIVADSSGHVHCLDAATGSPQWLASLELTPSTAGLVHDNMMIVGIDASRVVDAEQGAVCALDISTGELRWRHDVPIGVFAAPSRSIDKALLFTTGRDGSVRALDPATGALVWQHTVDHEILSPVAVGPHGLAFVCHGNVHALDPATGAEQWRSPHGRGTAVALAGTEIWSSARDGGLVRLDARTGNAEQVLAFPDAPQEAGWLTDPVLTRRHVVVGAGDGTLHVIDRSILEVVATATTSHNGPWTHLHVAAGRIFAAGSGGTMHVLGGGALQPAAPSEPGPADHGPAKLDAVNEPKQQSRGFFRRRSH